MSAEDDGIEDDLAPMSIGTGGIEDTISSTAANWSNQITNILCEMNHVIATHQDNGVDTEGLNDNMKIMSIALSTILMMASGQTDIPDLYYVWTERFLRSIKNDDGNYPTNVKNLLDFMKSRRPVLRRCERQIETSIRPKQSRIPVPVRSLGLLKQKDSLVASEDLQVKRRISCGSINNLNTTTRSSSTSSFHTSFNKIFQNLLFPQASMMAFSSPPVECRLPVTQNDNQID